MASVLVRLGERAIDGAAEALHEPVRHGKVVLLRGQWEMFGGLQGVRGAMARYSLVLS